MSGYLVLRHSHTNTILCMCVYYIDRSTQLLMPFSAAPSVGAGTDWRTRGSNRSERRSKADISIGLGQRQRQQSSHRKNSKPDSMHGMCYCIIHVAGTFDVFQWKTHQYFTVTGHAFDCAVPSSKSVGRPSRAPRASEREQRAHDRLPAQLRAQLERLSYGPSEW